MKRLTAFSLACLLTLSACGTNPSDRVISGAALGAGAGVVTEAIVGGSLGGAILLGAAAGAIVGGVTGPNQIHLGKPIWR